MPPTRLVLKTIGPAIAGYPDTDHAALALLASVEGYRFSPL